MTNFKGILPPFFAMQQQVNASDDINFVRMSKLKPKISATLAENYHASCYPHSQKLRLRLIITFVIQILAADWQRKSNEPL